MNTKIINLIDFERVNVLLEGFNKTTGFVTAILDLEGNVLSKSGWRNICTEFHRIHPKTRAKCTISDTELANKMAAGEKYHFYKCLNGLVDVAIPLIINGEHIANLFTGQFFFEKPDYSFFKDQAKKYGFNEKVYLDALEKVPVVSQAEVKTAMEFLLNMTELIVELTYRQLEQIELNRALQESEEKYRLLHEAAGVGIGYFTPDGVVISFNNIAAQNMNGKPEEFTGKSFFELFPAEAATLYFERIKKATHSVTAEEYIDEVELPNGKKWFSSIYNPIRDKNQNIAGIQILSTDLTDKKFVEEQKAEIYKRFERISANVPGAIFEFCLRPDGSYYIPYASSGIKEIYEVSPEEAVNDASKIIKQVHPDDRDNFFKSIAESAEKMETWHNDHRIILPSGKTIWVEGISTPQKLNDGSILWYGYINNITSRKQAENELIESKSFFEQLFLQSSTSTQLLDKEGWCIKINPKLSELFGVLPEHIEGRKYNIFHDDEIIRTGVIQHIQKVFENKETVRWEVNFDIQHASESTGVHVSKPLKKWFQNTSYPILDVQGELIYVIIQHEDITSRKQAEAEIREAEAKTREILIESEKRYRTLFENINAGFVLFEVVCDKKGKPIDLIIVAANDLFEKTTGLKNHEVTGKLLTQVLPGIEKDAANWVQTYGEVALTAKSRQFEQGSELLGYYYSINAFQPEPGKCAVTFIDTTERRHAELELKKSEERFSKIFHLSPIPIIIFSLSGKKSVDVNNAYLNLVGYSRNEIVNQTSEELNLFLDPENREIWLNEIKTLGTAIPREIKIRHKSGQIRDVFGTIELIELENEKFGMAMAIDITDRKRAEIALTESEERLRLSTELAHVAVWEYDYRTNKMTRSHNHDQLYGLEFQKKWNSETFMNAMYPEDKGISNKKLHQSIAIDGPDNYTVDFRVIHPDQSIHWLMVTAKVAERNSEGKGTLVRGVIMDITERKNLEEEILQKNKNLEALLKTSQELGKTLNLDSVLNEIIKHGTKLIGLDTGAIYLLKEDQLYLGAAVPPIPADFPEEFRSALLHDHPHIQKTISTGQPVIIPDLNNAVLTPAEQAIRESRNMRTLLYVPLKIENLVLGVMIIGTIKNTRIFSDDEINLYRTMSGQAAMAIYNSQLYEEINKLNEQLEQRVKDRTAELSDSQNALLNLVEDLNEKSVQLENSAKLLESKNKELETFTYSVSHDLKAPLRGIDGYSRLLEDSHYHKLDPEGQKFVKTIREGTKQMNQLIEDLLAYSRLERSVYRTSSINANELVKNILSILNNEIKEKKINLFVDVKNCLIHGDYDGLSIALRNIIENAVKFTAKNEKPEIKISLKENLSSWLFQVEDNGIGFDMKFHDRIFEIFQRLNLPEQYPGTGIGLAMVKKSAERMGGKIWAESSPGKGATFYLEMSKKN